MVDLMVVEMAVMWVLRKAAMKVVMRVLRKAARKAVMKVD